MATESAGSQFHGYDVINRNLRARLFKTGSEFSFGKYIGSEQLGVILGQYVGDGNEMNFVNGNPNATNMALWHVGLMALAKDLARLCSSGSTIQAEALNPKFAAAFAAVCDWPAASARSDSSLLAFWVSVMSYDAPESEYTAWKDYFQAQEFSNAGGEKIIEGLLATIFLNPYFLLRA
ncbi:MAG TPA: hypothetical protein VFV50_03925 [Bdellovibrionales bacterium]|nr:hypothetical protein [Bdellovibrionales bacterium]